MPEMCGLVAVGALACITALFATGAARVVLAVLQWRRQPTRRDALLLALLPPLALIAALLAPYLSLGDALHDELHLWMLAVTTHHAAHRVLHSANTLLLLVLGGRVLYTIFWWARAQTSAQILKRLASPEHSLDGVTVRMLATPTPHCFTVGVLRPAIYLSAGLLETLSVPQRTAMLAHEQAHVHHRDGFWTLLFRSFYSLLLLPGSGTLLTTWEAAAEQACDVAAIRKVGSACLVAEALVQVGCIQSSAHLVGSLAFGAKPGQLEARVNVLLAHDPARAAPSARPLCMILGLILTALLIVVPVLAHLAELFAYH